MHSGGKPGQIAVGLDVIEQIHAEIVEPEVGDGDASLEVFQLDDFFLQPAQLLLTVGEVVGFAVEGVVVAGGRDVGDHHSVFDAFLEVDVLVERDVGPVVDELDGAFWEPMRSMRPKRWMMRTGFQWMS